MKIFFCFSRFATNSDDEILDGATQVVVNAGGKHEHKLDVTKEGTVLGCNFKVSEHNIGFALYHEMDGKVFRISSNSNLNFLKEKRSH